MSLHFDEYIDRRNTNCLKHDFKKEKGYDEDILSLWVADMDFRAPKEVLEAIEKATKHGIFGYTEPKESYFKVLKKWFATSFDWEIKKDWLVKTPGVVYALAAAIRSLTKEGEAVMIQQPVYYPFSEVVVENNRKLVNNELRYEKGKYSIDFKDFEEKIKKEDVKIFILCSPHNPVGRVWKEDELRKIGEICQRHQVYVLSDEIHCDFTYEGNKHLVYASLGKAFEEHSIICTAPSKTFNLAGLQVSNVFVPNPVIRKKLIAEIRITGYSQLITLGLVAREAAYQYGAPWLEALKLYLKGNLAFVETFLEEKLPQIRLVKPEGTYLIWLDCTGLGLNGEELEHFIVKEAKLWLDGGGMFGTASDQFQRINIACPRSVLEKAMKQLEKAVKKRGL